MGYKVGRFCGLADLSALRQKFVFGEDAMPFPSVDEVADVLHPRHLKNISLEDVTYSLRLSNIASFLRVISEPDAAVDLLNDGGASGGRADVSAANHVKRRNEILVMAWKTFWDAVVPPSLRTSHDALDLWLDFATQVSQTRRYHY